MTPEQLNLARRLVLAVPELVRRQPSGQLVDSHGMEWVYSDEAEWLDGGSGFQVPDLTHSGTGGALLSMLGACVISVSGAAYNFAVTVAIHIGASEKASAFRGATLGEAAARALLAIREVKS